MYEEKKKLSLRDIIVQLALVILFVLILVWLFPTKGYVDKNYVSGEEFNNHLEALYGRLFADNVDSMKVAAQSYFTTSRLPKNVGDSVTLTLQDMLDKKMVLPFKDSNNESCDATKSYVQLTKMDEEYQMKVQLTCSDYSDYIIVYMGCYSYCDGLCETPKTPVKPSNPNKPTVNDKKYKYEYRLVTQDEYSNWSDWSNWSTSSKKEDTLTQVQTKKDSVLVSSGYYEKRIVRYDTIEKRVATGEYTRVQVGTKKIPQTTTKIVDTKDVPTTTSKGYYTEWKWSGTIEVMGSDQPSNTTTKRYTYRSSRVADACSGCGKTLFTTYNVETRTWVAGKTTTGSCSTYGSDYKLENNKCVKYGTVTTYIEVPTYEDQPVYKTVTEKVPVYERVYVNPTYRTVTYYRYRTRTLVSKAMTDTKWSNSASDKTLLDKGYKLIGKQEV